MSALFSALSLAYVAGLDTFYLLLCTAGWLHHTVPDRHQTKHTCKTQPALCTAQNYLAAECGGGETRLLLQLKLKLKTGKLKFYSSASAQVYGQVAGFDC